MEEMPFTKNPLGCVGKSLVVLGRCCSMLMTEEQLPKLDKLMKLTKLESCEKLVAPLIKLQGFRDSCVDFKYQLKMLY